jgi:RimJ/RimL family protein N-acetyltransferase
VADERASRKLAAAADAFVSNARNPSLRRAQLSFLGAWTAGWAFTVALGIVAVRPTRTSDRSALQDLFHRLPETDVETRFFHKLRSLTDTAAEHLCSVDYENEMAFAVVVGPHEHDRIVGASCYYRDPATRLAEVGYMVDPTWQGTGLATLLHQRSQEYAAGHGVRGFTADVLPHNGAMLKVFRRGQP